jgi:hypothetical protein
MNDDDDGGDDKMDLPRMGWEGMTSPGQGQVAGSGENANKNFRLHKMQGI